MSRTLSGYRAADLAGALAAYRQRIADLRAEREQRMVALDAEIQGLNEQVAVGEAEVAAELERIRTLLKEFGNWNERLRRRVDEARERFQREEAREWAALAALEARALERRSIAESLGRDVVSAVARAQAALAEASAYSAQWAAEGAVLDAGAAAAASELARADHPSQAVEVVE